MAKYKMTFPAVRILCPRSIKTATRPTNYVIEIEPYMPNIYGDKKPCSYCQKVRKKYEDEHTSWAQFEPGQTYHLVQRVEEREKEKNVAKKKKEKAVDLSKLLERRLFVPHEEKVLDPDEELSCYITEQEAVSDPCCEYVTEVLIIRTDSRDTVVAALKERGIEVMPKVVDDGTPIEGKQVIALMKLAKSKGTTIEKLIKMVLNQHLIVKQLSKAQADYILGREDYDGGEPEKLVEKAAGESSIVGG